MTAFPLDDVIAALASPPGGAARGIIRLSGPDVRGPLRGLFTPDDPQRWERATRAERHTGRLRLPDCRVPLDADVLLWPTRRSYTGAPLAELHLPGSPPLLEGVLAELHARGARPARPGEFTLRAFLAGRIDLVQAEAVLGTIEAHDQRELETALAQLAGGLSGKLATIRGELLDLLADLEAGLDFVDEDIEFVPPAELVERVASARTAIQQLLEQASQRMRTTGTRCVVLAGLPNAGKSTLFNALVGEEAALVSPIRGTTRDWLSAELHWDGVAVDLVDTAGWEDESVPGRESAAEEEIMAAAAALRGGQFDRADLVLWCTAADLDPQTRSIDAELFARLQRENRPLMRVWTRCDLATEIEDSDPAALRIQAPPEEGPSPSILDALRRAILERLAAPATPGRELVGMTASRARESLASAEAALARAEQAAAARFGEEILAIEIREALDHLGRILGTVFTDDILDRIFSKFCIGK